MMKFVPKILLVAVLLTGLLLQAFSESVCGAQHHSGRSGEQKTVPARREPDLHAEYDLRGQPENTAFLRRPMGQKQLKIKEAERMLEESQKDIDQMVQEYRNSLLTHKVDQFYVDKNIDTLFTDTQIADYYNQNKADFILDKTLVKARIVRIPRSYDKKKDDRRADAHPARGWLSGSARPVRQKTISN